VLLDDVVLVVVRVIQSRIYVEAAALALQSLSRPMTMCRASVAQRVVTAWVPFRKRSGAMRQMRRMGIAIGHHEQGRELRLGPRKARDG
jgi:hypothetical protein